MAVFEFKAGVDVDVQNAAVLKAINGDLNDLYDILGRGGDLVKFDLKVNAEGAGEVERLEDGIRKLNAQQKESRKVIQDASRAQEGSLTSLRQSVNAIKQQRDALNQNNAKWAEADQKYRSAAAALQAAQGIQAGSIRAIQQEKTALQESINNQNLSTQARFEAVQSLNALNAAQRQASGIQKGSLADLRAQRAELLALRDATTKIPNLGGPPGGGGGPSWDDLNRQLKQVDGQINQLTPGFNRFFGVFSKIATVQAGFIAVTTAVSALGGVVNAYTSRLKQIEAFNLALKNIGLTQAETNAAFKDATAIATRLGAPIQQVEKGYKRMLPALQSVGSSAEQSSKFIENVTARTQTLGLNTEESGRLLEAFAQVLSKGKLQSEELNQQISELDGSFRTQFAQALGVSQEALNSLIEDGKVTAPIFVEAVNKMSNGVEELQRRIQNGTATIQQLQNQIQNVNTQNLAQIGALIEPAIKSFLKIGLAVSQFFQEFSKTELFQVFTTILNQTAKGIEIFVTNLLKAVQAIAEILGPIATVVNAVLKLGDGFGGLIGITTQVVAGLLLLKGGIMAFGKINEATKSIQAFGSSIMAVGKQQNYLGQGLNVSAFDKFRQKVENTRAGFVGFAKTIGDQTASFLGIKKAADTAGQGVGTLATATKGAGAAAAPFTAQSLYANYVMKQSGMTAAQYSQFLQQVKAQYGGVAAGATTSGAAVTANGQAMARATGQALTYANAMDRLKTSQAGAVGAGTGFGAKLKDGLGAIINPLTIGITLAGSFINIFQEGARQAQSVKDAYVGVFQPVDEWLSKINEKQKTTSSTVTKSVGDATEAVKKSGDAAAFSGGAWAALGIGLGVVAIAAASAATGGLAGAAAYVAFAGAAGAAAGSAATLGQAAKEVGKSEFGKKLIESAEKFDKKLANVRTKLKDLGIKGLNTDIGQLDFSKFADGSKNLSVLAQGYRATANTIKEQVEADQQLLAAERAKEQPNQANIAYLNERIKKGQEEVRAAEASAAAASEEIAARIAAGKAVDAQTVSLEELARAREMADDKIDIAKLNAAADAQRKYGQFAKDAALVEASSTGAEIAASQAKASLAQKQLNILAEKKRLNGALSIEEQQAVTDLTKVVAEENGKQVELQNKLGQAIVDAFERGVQKARAVSDVYGQVASSLKSLFDGITGAASGRLSALSGLVSTVSERYLSGIERAKQAELKAIQDSSLSEDEKARRKEEAEARYAQMRQAVVRQELQMQAKIAEAEYQLAQVKLAVQNQIAQNESKIAQMRYEAEARIAEARGEKDLAAAYRNAANVQGQITQGLQTQYEIESESLAIQKQVNDQKLINKGLDEGIGNSAREVGRQIGVQAVNMEQVGQRVDSVIAKGKTLGQTFGQAATSASNIQVGKEGQQISSGTQEMQKLKAAAEEGRSAVAGVNQEAQKLKDPIFEALKAAESFQGGIDKAAGSIRNATADASKLTGELQKAANVAGGGMGGGRGGGSSPGGVRAMGGPVSAGMQYFVNDGGGREGFVNKFGDFSMLRAGRNYNWVAPSSGTIIPANMVSQYLKAADINRSISRSTTSSGSSTLNANNISASLDSGNLVQRVASAMSGSNTTQRITNNVTIQSQEPVMDASRIMTNVARMRLRNSRRI